MRKAIWMDDEPHRVLKTFCASVGISLKKFVEYSLNPDNYKIVKILAENGVDIKEDREERE